MFNKNSKFAEAPAHLIVGVLSLILIAVSVWFRIWHLGNIPGLYGDEASYGTDSFDILHGHPIASHTPTGNPKNIFYYLPVLLLHAIFPRSIVLLRTTAVVCGIAAIAVNYMLCRRMFGHYCALLTSLLIATLPECIAQSRFGWDPCESILIDLFVVYGSLAIVRREANPNRPIWTTFLACIIAFAIHPSNLFVGFLLPTAIMFRWAPEVTTYFRTGNRLLRCILAAAAIALVIGGGMVAFHKQLEVVGKFRNTSKRSFVLDYASLYSGRPIYNWMSGYPEPIDRTDAIDFLSVLPWVFCAGYAVRVLGAREKSDAADKFLAVGWLVEIAVFAVVAGAISLEPGNDRYGLCLIVPGVLMLVRALQRLWSNRIAMIWAPGLTVLILSALLLIGFYHCYFRFVMATGGSQGGQLTAAATDPKLTAINYVLSQCPGNEPCYIMCHTWQTYEIARYFAAGHPNVHVPMILKITHADVAASLQAMKQGNFWTVDFISQVDHVRKELAIPGVELTFIEVLDYARHPAVIIGHPVFTRRAPDFRFP